MESLMVACGGTRREVIDISHLAPWPRICDV